MSYRRFTWTSYEEEPPVYDEDKMTYMIYGKEVCPTTKREHWQGYVELVKKTRWETMKKLWPKLSLRVSLGTGMDNYIYCSKDGNFKEFGTLAKPGERNDLKEVVEEIGKGARVDHIAIEHPVQFLKYHKGIRELVNIHQKKDAKADRPVEVIVLWGDSGAGKTRKALEIGGHDYYISTAGNGWYDGYAGENVLIIDEMAKEAIPFRTMLRLLDRHPLQVPYKGGMVWARWSKVVITSNIDPNYWYPGEDKAPLFRRFAHVEHMTLRPVERVPLVPEVEMTRHDSESDYVPIVVAPSVPEVGGNTRPQPPTSARTMMMMRRRQ